MSADFEKKLLDAMSVPLPDSLSEQEIAKKLKVNKQKNTKTIVAVRRAALCAAAMLVLVIGVSSMGGALSRKKASFESMSGGAPESAAEESAKSDVVDMEENIYGFELKQGVSTSDASPYLSSDGCNDTNRAEQALVLNLYIGEEIRLPLDSFSRNSTVMVIGAETNAVQNVDSVLAAEIKICDDDTVILLLKALEEGDAFVSVSDDEGELMQLMTSNSYRSTGDEG